NKLAPKASTRPVSNANCSPLADGWRKDWPELTPMNKKPVASAATAIKPAPIQTNNGLNTIWLQLTTWYWPLIRPAPTGACIHDCKATTQKAASNVPSASKNTKKVCNQGLKRRAPKSTTPEKHDLNINVVSTAAAINGPAMSPATSLKCGQTLPNWINTGNAPASAKIEATA